MTFPMKFPMKIALPGFRIEHPNILHTSDELSQSITPKTPGLKKSGQESSSEVCQMIGCSNKKYENFDFIRQRLIPLLTGTTCTNCITHPISWN